ncbi:unnamed protein product, partial [Vitis vinifera]|uniref:Uncharacterized protein n=1 Tax=Vitis vinifera TaxID=29760 RepID=D7T7X4_VITVI
MTSNGLSTDPLGNIEIHKIKPYVPRLYIQKQLTATYRHLKIGSSKTIFRNGKVKSCRGRWFPKPWVGDSMADSAKTQVCERSEVSLCVIPHILYLKPSSPPVSVSSLDLPITFRSTRIETRSVSFPLMIAIQLTSLLHLSQWIAPTSISESSLTEGSSSVEAKTVTYIETPTYRRMRNREYNGVKLSQSNMEPPIKA